MKMYLRSWIRPATTLGYPSRKRCAPLAGMISAVSASPTAQQPVEASGIGCGLPFMQDCIYLDYNATTPVFPEVAEEMLPFLSESFGNPSSTHSYGKRNKAALDLARCRVAEAVGCQPEEIYFTSCGTESDNWAIMGSVQASKYHCPHVVTTNIEHPAISLCLQAMASQGLLTFTAVDVDSEGIVHPEAIRKALLPETCLVTVMHANNEIGSIQPLSEISEIATHHGAWMHTDAAQSLGKVPVNFQELGVDMATIVGHKIGAPKGVAALYIRRGVELPKLLHGGGQEHGLRAGTESIVLLSGFGKAAALIFNEGHLVQRHMKDMRARLKEKLEQSIPEDRLRFNGPIDDSKRIANTLSVSVRGVNASLLLLELQDTVAASAGAACKRGEGATLSDTLQAIKIPVEYSLGTLRLSVGRHTTPAEIDAAAERIIAACAKQGTPIFN